MTCRALYTLSLLSLTLASVVVATGCNNRGRPRGTGTDGGPIMTMDGGGTRDGGMVIMLMDGGMMMGFDGGTTGCVPACSAGQECRSGTCVTVTPMCRANPIEAAPGVFCSSSTTSCVEACADGACIATCLMSDPSADCFSCANQNIIACEVRAGCQSQWDCLASCIDDNCPTGSASTCVDSFCSAELATWNTCTAGATECGTAWTTCIP